MANYLMFESRDPFVFRECEGFAQTAISLQQGGHQVVFFLVENGVLPARRTVHSEALSQLSKQGVTIYADAFALAERGIAREALIPAVQSAELSLAMDLIARGDKTLWH